MYFDFEDSHLETPSVESAISRREGILLSVVIHCVVLAVLVTLPEHPFFQRLEAERQAEVQRQFALRSREPARFVFVQPRVDLEAPEAPPRAEASDRDRVAAAPERAADPTNRLPFSRGNSAARVDAEELRGARERGDTGAAPPRARATEAEALGEGEPVVDLGGDPALSGLSAKALDRIDGTQVPQSGLADALRNIDRYITPEVFENLSGAGGQPGGTIQFDTMGVDFGPWLQRFVAQVRRNWFIPMAARTFRGHVVITFYIHRDGEITELTVVDPSRIPAFAYAAYNALRGSNPTYPLPPEYPVDRAFFTVTFYYNEIPPRR